jgi:hypothetical protein
VTRAGTLPPEHEPPSYTYTPSATGRVLLGLALSVVAPVPAKAGAYLCNAAAAGHDGGRRRRLTATVWGAAALVGLGLPFLAAPALCLPPPSAAEAAAEDAAALADGRRPPPPPPAVGPLMAWRALAAVAAAALVAGLCWAVGRARRAGRCSGPGADGASGDGEEERQYRHMAAAAASEAAAGEGEAWRRAGGGGDFLAAVWGWVRGWRLLASVAAAGAILGVALSLLQVAKPPARTHKTRTHTHTPARTHTRAHTHRRRSPPPCSPCTRARTHLCLGHRGERMAGSFPRTHPPWPFGLPH